MEYIASNNCREENENLAWTVLKKKKKDAIVNTSQPFSSILSIYLSIKWNTKIFQLQVILYDGEKYAILVVFTKTK